MRHRLSPPGPAAVALAVLMVSCGGSTGPRGTDDSEDTRRVLEFPEFRADVMEVFDRNGCTSGCHDLGQGGLTLLAGDPTTSYAQLVNEPAHSESFLRVKPSDPDSSYLVIKIEGRNVVGSPMPPGDALDLIDRTNLRKWIENGAPFN